MGKLSGECQGCRGGKGRKVTREWGSRSQRTKRKEEEGKKGKVAEGYAAVEMAWGRGMKGRRMQVQSTALGTLASGISQ